MKTAIIFITIFLVGTVYFDKTTAAKAEETSESINKKCITKTGVTPAELKELEKGDFAKITKPSEKLQCYVKCVLDHTEVLEEETINKNTMEKKFGKSVPKAELEKAMKTCAHFKGKDHCEAAFNVAKCFADNKVKLF